MPRRAVRVLPAALLATMLGLGGCAAEDGQAVTAVDTVNVTINCYPDSTVSVALRPWVKRVPGGGTIDWVVAEPSNGIVDTFYVRPKLKGSGRWMYSAKPGGRPGIPARSGPMNENANSGDRGRYDLIALCRPQLGHPAFEILIDPDVVVD
ncbi:MAG TPA: hypothetical protein VMK53_04595 [Gemmatimonadales bacterium]|nr:hypothetical protein [Gemmatimonadales bacterium]